MLLYGSVPALRNSVQTKLVSSLQIRRLTEETVLRIGAHMKYYLVRDVIAIVSTGILTVTGVISLGEE